MRRRFIPVVAAVALLSASGAAIAAPPPEPGPPDTCAPGKLIFVADESAPPTEFRDDQGRPAGIHIDLIRALERQLGIPIEIRLMPRGDATTAVQEGRAHLTTIALAGTRKSQFDFLAQTVRSRVSVLLRDGVRPVAGPTDLSGLRVTTTFKSYTYELLKNMPAHQRPELVVVTDKEYAARIWAEGGVDGMAGSGAALTWLARQKGQSNFVEVPFETVMMHFVTRLGCGESLKAVTSAMQTLRDQGVVDAVRERWVSPPPPVSWWQTMRWLGSFLAIFMMAMAWNWTLRRQVRERTADLEAAKSSAEKATRAKSEFLATMSHEIRTPLNAVIATASVLETTTLDPEQRELVEVIQQGGKSLLSVVSDVLDFSKVEAGKLELHAQPFEVRTLMQETVTLVGRTASDKGLTATAIIDPDVPAWVLGDSLRLRQVLLNLLSNAVKFTTAGAVVMRVSSRTNAGNAVLSVAVTDSGPGIPADRLHRLFQPFTQADSSMTRRFGGTGLGLTISRSLIKMMGGDIAVDSQVGVGSTFSFEITLPVSAQPLQTLRPLTNASAALRVLMAEDNPINQLVQRRMITQLGHSCRVVNDGAEAIAAAGEEDYDVVVLDLQMPGVGGLQAAEGIRQLAHRPWLIILTADATEDSRQQCRRAQVDDFLTKPVTITGMAEALARVGAAAAA